MRLPVYPYRAVFSYCTQATLTVSMGSGVAKPLTSCRPQRRHTQDDDDDQGGETIHNDGETNQGAGDTNHNDEETNLGDGDTNNNDGETNQGDRETIRDERFLRCLDDVEKMYDASPADDDRARFCRLLEGSYVVVSLCDAVTEEVACERYGDQERFKVLKRAMAMLEKLTTCSEDVAGTVVSHERVMPVLLQKLGKRWAEQETDACSPHTDDEKHTLVSGSLAILHNISSYKRHVSALRNIRSDNQPTESPPELPAVIDVMHTYLKSSRNERNRLTAIAVLANTTNDNSAETKGVTTNAVILKFMVNAASRALGDPKLMYEGLAAEQLFRVLHTLVQKHQLKMVLVEAGILDLLEKSIESPAEDIREESFSILWELAFDEHCAKEIAARDLIVNYLLKKHRRPAPKGTPDGPSEQADTQCDQSSVDAAWVLQCLSHVDLKIRALTKMEETKEVNWDCFLSYSWDNELHKATVHKLYEFLTANGFKVWLDKDKMRLGKYIVDKMAEGIGGSSVVLVCASTGYRKSRNCHAEANFAFALGKDIIPLYMEEPEVIKAASWLGFIVAPIMRIDFSKSHTDDREFKKIANELLRGLRELVPHQTFVDGSPAEPAVAETQRADSSREENAVTTQLLLTAAQDTDQPQTSHAPSQQDDTGKGVMAPEDEAFPHPDPPSHAADQQNHPPSRATDQGETDTPAGEGCTADVETSGSTDDDPLVQKHVSNIENIESSGTAGHGERKADGTRIRRVRDVSKKKSTRRRSAAGPTAENAEDEVVCDTDDPRVQKHVSRVENIESPGIAGRDEKKTGGTRMRRVRDVSKKKSRRRRSAAGPTAENAEDEVVSDTDDSRVQKHVSRDENIESPGTTGRGEKKTGGTRMRRVRDVSKKTSRRRRSAAGPTAENAENEIVCDTENAQYGCPKKETADDDTGSDTEDAEDVQSGTENTDYDARGDADDAEDVHSGTEIADDDARGHTEDAEDARSPTENAEDSTESAEDGAPRDMTVKKIDKRHKRPGRNPKQSQRCHCRQSVAPRASNFPDEEPHGGETTDQNQGGEPARPLTARSSLDEEKIRSWKSEEIQDWLDRSKLKSAGSRRRETSHAKCSLQMYHCPTCWSAMSAGGHEAKNAFKKKRLDKLTGDELIFLRKLRDQAPDLFYNILKYSLGIRSLAAASKFDKGLDSLETA